tara:strand:+ start:2077 stop:2370 length:294 start_codon:yes stop_codon:yes gene_type:complete
MNKEELAIDEIRDYVENLKKNLITEKEENDKLNTINDSLKNENIDLISKINNLKDEIKMLKIAKQIINDETNKNKDIKLMINEMVREIDKCIGLMNK